jgi:hypothetical protein
VERRVDSVSCRSKMMPTNSPKAPNAAVEPIRREKEVSPIQWLLTGSGTDSMSAMEKKSERQVMAGCTR